MWRIRKDLTLGLFTVIVTSTTALIVQPSVAANMFLYNKDMQHLIQQLFSSTLIGHYLVAYKSQQVVAQFHSLACIGSL